MGHWSHGMQANDTATAAIDWIKEVRAGKVRDVDPDWSPGQLFAAMEIRQPACYNAMGILGVADWMLDNGEDLPSFECDDLLAEAFQAELMPLRLAHWGDSDRRKAALVRFGDRLSGAEIDEAAQAEDNKSLKKCLEDLME